jgi:hypothetical protein
VTRRDQSEKVKLIRASAANLEYFFSNQKDASWLPFLLQEGFFKEPTPPETGTTDEGQAWFRYPNWPESQYLARIATEAPQQVVEAIERIPETPNPRVHEDIIVAATALPGELAARVAKREQRWLAGYEGHLVSLPHSAGDLLAHLAREGEMKSAFALAGTLLKIVIDPRYENQTSHHRAVALVGDWEYGEILAVDGCRAREGLPLPLPPPCRRDRARLRRGIQLRSHLHLALGDRVPRTEHRAQPARHDGRAVRDTAVAEAKKGAESRDLVLAKLARHGAPLFRRIALFVLSDFGSPEQVAAILTDGTLIDEVNVWHEYAELLRKRFSDLDIQQRGGDRLTDRLRAGV